MEIAVQLVEAYLNINGYFTVAEYPVVETSRPEQARTATDLDILAFRFPLAGTPVRGGARRATGPVALEPDPALGAPAGEADMIVGEVKEGPARFNPAARDPLVLEAALVRFGCCPPDAVPQVVRRLLRNGRAMTPAGHRVRLVAFGAEAEPRSARYRVVPLSHVIAFLQSHLRRHWDTLGRARLTQPVLAFLALLEKADQRGGAEPPEAPQEEG